MSVGRAIDPSRAARSATSPQPAAPAAPRVDLAVSKDSVEHDPKTGQFTVSSGTSTGEVAEHYGYEKTASKEYSLAKAGKHWSAKAGSRVTETYRHPETGHSITVKGPNWKHNFAKSGGNSRAGVGAGELHEHLTQRRSPAKDAEPRWKDRRYDEFKKEMAKPRPLAASPPARDMTPTDWRGMLRGFFKFIMEEAKEPEHKEVVGDAEFEEVKHPRGKGGKFGSGGGASSDKSPDEVGTSLGITIERNPKTGMFNTPYAALRVAIKDPSKTQDSLDKLARMRASQALGREFGETLETYYERKPELKKLNEEANKVAQYLKSGEPAARDAALSTSPNSALPAAAGVIFVGPTNRVLFAKRSAKGDQPASWAFPGGACKPNETAAECAAREAREETGYDCLAKDNQVLLRPIDRRTVNDVDFETFLVRCPEEFEPTLNDEHTECEWIPWGRWPTPLHPGVAETLEGLPENVEELIEGLEIGEDVDLKRNPDGSLQPTVALTDLLPFTTEELRDAGTLKASHKHPGPARTGSEAMDAALAMDWRGVADLEEAPLAHAFDRDTTRTYGADGHLHVAKAHISKGCVNPYRGKEIPGYQDLGLDPDKPYRLLRDPEEIAKAVSTFNNLPILSTHRPVSAEAHPPELVIGSTGTDAEFNAPYLDNSLVFWPKSAIEAIESNDRKQLSAAYRYVPVMEPGIYEGEPYDGRMTELIGNHIALVRDGRAGADVVVGDERLIWYSPTWANAKGTTNWNDRRWK